MNLSRLSACSSEGLWLQFWLPLTIHPSALRSFIPSPSPPPLPSLPLPSSPPTPSSLNFSSSPLPNTGMPFIVLILYTVVYKQINMPYCWCVAVASIPPSILLNLLLLHCKLWLTAKDMPSQESEIQYSTGKISDSAGSVKTPESKQPSAAMRLRQRIP